MVRSEARDVDGVLRGGNKACDAKWCGGRGFWGFASANFCTAVRKLLAGNDVRILHELRIGIFAAEIRESRDRRGFCARRSELRGARREEREGGVGGRSGELGAGNGE